MNPDLESKLLDKYPKLFASKQFWGFECGDGWYDLLDYTCGAIASYGNAEDVMVDQIKEKFGQLRFYVTGGDDMIEGMIWMAEHMSGHICETCGNRGELRTGSWLVTLCDMHHDARTGEIPHGHT
jgi:hypothetical protein